MNRVELLSELLKVDSTNPPGNEGPAVDVLDSYLTSAGIETRVHKSPGGRPNLVARIEGPTDVPALVLLSHTDVVGVETESWTHDPFGGEIHDGYIWGRGALDMKGLAAMHASALSSFARSGATPNREVILVSVADEEAGGTEGASWLLVEHPDDVGLGDGRPPPEVIGEGGYGLLGVVERPLMPIVLGEKSALWIDLHATGDPGHGAIPPVKQAPHNLASALNAVSGFYPPRVHPIMRDQFSILAKETFGPRRAFFRGLASTGGRALAKALQNQLREAGAIGALLSDTVTPTQISAGYKHNVVPGEAMASLDCRLLPNTDADAFIDEIEKAIAPHDVDVVVTARHTGPVSGDGPLYSIIEEVSRTLADDSGATPLVVPSLSPAMTDVRYFREREAQGYGWAPISLGPELVATLHGHDERIPLDGFERGADAMAEVVSRASA